MTLLKCGYKNPPPSPLVDPCGEIKPESGFYEDGKGKRKSVCQDCIKKALRKRYSERLQSAGKVRKNASRYSPRGSHEQEG